MIKLNWAIICKGCSIDRESNNLSLFEVLENINIKYKEEIPKFINFPFQLIMLWSKEENENIDEKGKITLIDNNENVLLENPFDIKIDPKHSNYRMKVGFNGLPINGSSKYHFLIKRREGDIYIEEGRVSLSVNIDKE